MQPRGEGDFIVYTIEGGKLDGWITVGGEGEGVGLSAERDERAGRGDGDGVTNEVCWKGGWT